MKLLFLFLTLSMAGCASIAEKTYEVAPRATGFVMDVRWTLSPAALERDLERFYSSTEDTE